MRASPEPAGQSQARCGRGDTVGSRIAPGLLRLVVGSPRAEHPGSEPAMNAFPTGRLPTMPSWVRPAASEHGRARRSCAPGSPNSSRAPTQWWSTCPTSTPSAPLCWGDGLRPKSAEAGGRGSADRGAGTPGADDPGNDQALDGSSAYPSVEARSRPDERLSRYPGTPTTIAPRPNRGLRRRRRGRMDRPVARTGDRDGGLQQGGLRPEPIADAGSGDRAAVIANDNDAWCASTPATPTDRPPGLTNLYSHAPQWRTWPGYSDQERLAAEFAHRFATVHRTARRRGLPGAAASTSR